MKFSRNLISKFIDISQINNEKICKTLNDIGLEVESVSKIEIPKNIVIGKVIEKTKHPDATKLNVCKVDVGNEVLQIVCGASNVAKDQFVPVALIGAKLEKLTIKKSILRGIESCGMICSSTEIGLPKIEDGIFVLDESIGELVLGKELLQYQIFNDTLFEVGITPNRGDCFSLFGIAKDLAVAFNLNLKVYKDKERNNDITLGIGRILNISFDENLQSSLYYKVVELEKLKNFVNLKLYLAFCDNLHEDYLQNIVEFSVYMTGVLINAYKIDSYDKKFLDNGKKIILNIKKDSNGVESVYYNGDKLSDICIYIDDKYKAGTNSRLVIFEASFAPANHIAEIIFKNNLKTTENIAYLSKRGSSPALEDGMTFLCSILLEMSESLIYSSSQEIIQNYPLRRIDFIFDDINNIIGNKIGNEEIANILKKMNFIVNSASDESFIAVNPPLYRQDINTVQDVAEEILRIKSIDSITSNPQKFKQYKNMDENYNFYKFKRAVSQKAIANRFFECVHYLFYKKEILEFYGYETLPKNLDLANPITSDLDTLRSSLIPAMLDSVLRNQNYGFTSIKLFEIGSIYNKNRDESLSLAFVVSGNKTNPTYPNPKGESWNFYSFVESISQIIGKFTLIPANANIIYHPNICANIIKNENNIGVIGKVNPFIASKLEISDESFICEISLYNLFEDYKIPHIFKEFSKYQISQRDITILVDKNLSFLELKNAIIQENFDNLKEIIPLDVYTNSIFGDKISLSFRILFQSMIKTLNEDELKIDNIIDFLKDRFKAIPK